MAGHLTVKERAQIAAHWGVEFSGCCAEMVAWGCAKEEVYRAKSHTLEQLEDRIRKIITNVPHDFLQKTVDSIPGRLRKLVDAAGAYGEF